MEAVPTTLEILDKTLTVVAQIKSFYPLDKGGTIIQYSNELDNYGQCKFRVSAYDTVFDTYGDVFVPHQYHVRIRKGTVTIWQGAIIENTKRTKMYMEIIAAQYLFYLGKKLIKRTSPDANGTTDIYRIFNSGTMADAVTAIINETITDYKNSQHVLANMTLGTIQNPNYPPNMTSAYTVNSQPQPLTGPWQFGTDTQASPGPILQFDFQTVFYVLRAFGVYAYADFNIDNNLAFNFQKFIGNDKHLDVTLTYGQQGNIVDYNLPRLGQRQANSLFGIATDLNGVILHEQQSNQASVDRYGLLEAVAAYSDVKSQPILNARVAAEMPIISTADETNAIVVLDENNFQVGQYGLGDIININVQNKGVNFVESRRIVGITTKVNGTGRESITLQTNIPLDWQYSV